MDSDGAGASLLFDREKLLADRTLFGRVLCRAYARRMDEWLAELFEARIGDRRGISLVAIGGYGRSELSPQSDLDVMLLHDGWSEAELGPAAESLWFPIWDSKISLGHSVRTSNQALELAETDLETATSLLSLRHIGGDQSLSEKMMQAAAAQWRHNRRTWLPQLVADAGARAHTQGEVAFLLEPDLKNSSGGLRDIHTLQWIEAGGVDMLVAERRDLRASREVLLEARVELHRAVGRKGDVLLLEQQDGVADALGIDDADVMMSQIAAAARTISWISEDVFLRVRNSLRRFTFRAGRPKTVAHLSLIHI